MLCVDPSSFLPLVFGLVPLVTLWNVISSWAKYGFRHHEKHITDFVPDPRLQVDTEEFPTSLVSITVAQRWSVLVTARNDTSENFVVHANLE